MNTVRRSRGILKMIRVHVCRNTVQKHVTAGDRACMQMVLEIRQRQKPGPSDTAIMAWAKFDLSRELLGGFWDFSAA